jgi:dUTP pyrophosphatase
VNGVFSQGISFALVDGGVPPVRATPGSACYDLCARVPQETAFRLPDGTYGIDIPCALSDAAGIVTARSVLVPCGIRLALPPGWEAQVRSRSGLATKGIITPVGLGTIDSDYNKEIHALLMNLSGRPYVVRSNNRIAQVIFSEISRTYMQEVTQLPERAWRKGGFGSTGV